MIPKPRLEPYCGPWNRLYKTQLRTGLVSLRNQPHPLTNLVTVHLPLLLKWDQSHPDGLYLGRHALPVPYYLLHSKRPSRGLLVRRYYNADPVS